MDPHDGPELVRLIYNVAGRRTTKLLFWMALIVVVILVAPKIFNALDVLSLRFQGTTIDGPQAILQLTTFGYAFIAALLSLGVLMTIAIPLGIFFGLTLEIGLRSSYKMDNLCVRLEEIVVLSPSRAVFLNDVRKVHEEITSGVGGWLLRRQKQKK